MFARNIMTKPVITVSPDTPVPEIVSMLVKRSISAVPVVTESGKIVGIVSEGDLIHRVRGDHETPRSWRLKLLSDHVSDPREYLKSHGRKASDVMSKPVETTTEFASIGEIAATLESRGIKRLPVVDKDGCLVGIVSRANVIQVLVGENGTQSVADSGSDEKIRDNIENELNDHSWGTGLFVNIDVEDGVVRLWGMADTDTARKAIELAALNTNGVESVENNLGIARFSAPRI